MKVHYVVVPTSGNRIRRTIKCATMADLGMAIVEDLEKLSQVAQVDSWKKIIIEAYRE